MVPLDHNHLIKNQHYFKNDSDKNDSVMRTLSNGVKESTIYFEDNEDLELSSSENNSVRN